MAVYEVSQLLAHMTGDYAIQSDWMATEKTKRSWPCLLHVLVYSIPFVIFLHPTLLAWFVIVSTHFVIDRWRLARHVIWVKNHMAPRAHQPPSFRYCRKTGFGPATPDYLAVWLMILTDNLAHVLINGLALFFL